MSPLGEWEEPEPDDTTADDDAPEEPFYASLPEFVEDFLAPTLGRAIGGQVNWCSQWWKHTEAIYRLEALWRAWEQLRLDAGTGVSVWLRDHADHHMRVLTDDHGPFSACSNGHRPREVTLATEPPPEGLFNP